MQHWPVRQRQKAVYFLKTKMRHSRFEKETKWLFSEELHSTIIRADLAPAVLSIRNTLSVFWMP